MDWLLRQLPAAAVLLPTDDTGAVYVAPMGNYNVLDHRRAARDDWGFDFALGYNIARILPLNSTMRTETSASTTLQATS